MRSSEEIQVGRAELMKELLGSWDISEVVSTEPIHSYSGSATAVTVVSGDRYVLKRRNMSSDLDKELDLLVSLQGSGVPVAVPVGSKTGVPYVASNDDVYVLYPFLRGDVIRDHYGRGAPERARRFGQAIALLHIALRDWSPEGDASDLDLVAHVRGWALPAVSRHPDYIDVKRVMAVAETYSAVLEPVAGDLAMQWIHRDMHPENMLFDDGELTGILDFEMVRRGPRVFDPCYCATSILVGGWEVPRNRTAWPRLLRELISGYEEAIPLSEAERRAIFAVLCGIEFIFLAFSLERQQYDPARCNQEALFWLHDNRSAIGV